MSPPSRLPMRSSLLGRVVRSSVLSLGIWSLGMSNIGLLYAYAQTIPSDVRSGYTLLEQGLVNQAIDWLEQSVQQFPESLEARLGLAIAYRRAGRDADAFQMYEQALTIDPTNRLALLSLGTLGAFRPEWQERGIAALTTLLQHDANDIEARSQRALLYIYEGQFDAAIADYEQVLQRNPQLATIAGAAQAYAYGQEYEQSLTLFERYLQGGGTLEGDAATAYARALRETGDAPTAVQVLETQLRQQSTLSNTAMRMRAEQAMNYAAIGRFDLAETMVAPLRGRSEARMVLGRALIAIARTSPNPAFLTEGIEVFEAVLAEESLTPAMQREIADVLASFPPSQTTALEIYRQLGAAQSDDRGLQTQIAVLEYETGQLSEADLLTRLSQVLPTIPDNPTQQQLIVQALIRLKTPDPLLLPLYENLVRIGMTEPLLYLRIAQLYVRQEDYDTARSVIATYQATTPETTDLAAELLLAGIDQRQGHLADSAERYQRIIDSNPADRGILSGALQGLAGVYQSQEKFSDALTLYNRVVALNPDDPTKQLGRAALEYQAGALGRSEAETLLNQWLTTQPLTQTPPELFSLVGALPAEPNRELLYRALVDVDPGYIPVQLRLAEVMVAQDKAATLKYVEQLVARSPNNINVYFLQGHIAQQVGELGQAASAYESIVTLDPENVDAWSALGGVRFQQRRYEAAVEAYSQVLSLQPDHQIARAALNDLEIVRRRIIPILRRTQSAQQVEPPVVTPDMTRLQTQPTNAEFVPQGEAPLPWETP